MKMFFVTIIVSVLVLFGVNNVSGQTQCSNCVLLRSCQGAIDYISAKKNNVEAMRKVKELFCGTQFIYGVKAPKCETRSKHLVPHAPGTAPYASFARLVLACIREKRTHRHGQLKGADKKIIHGVCEDGEAVKSNHRLIDQRQVCCSDFTTDDSNGNRWSNPDDNLKDYIESHPNLSLLPESCGGIDGKKIFGGTIANIYEFPWMALISHRTREGSGNLQFKCGGSIINSRYILTAAHCVYNKKVAGVRIGEFDIQSKQDCQGEYPHYVCETNIQDIPVEQVIAHKDYQRIPIENDIALIRLKKPINMTLKNAKPICLPVARELRDRQITSGDKTGTVAGWGITETGSESAVLRKVDIPILSATACRELYNKNSDPGSPDLTFNKICAGKIDKDSCNGDSGGPLMLEDEVNGKYRSVQYGIVSFGPKQCGSLFPGVYTDVTKYMKWILDNIKA